MVSDEEHIFSGFFDSFYATPANEKFPDFLIGEISGRCCCVCLNDLRQRRGGEIEIRLLDDGGDNKHVIGADLARQEIEQLQIT